MPRLVVVLVQGLISTNASMIPEQPTYVNAAIPLSTLPISAIYAYRPCQQFVSFLEARERRAPRTFLSIIQAISLSDYDVVVDLVIFETCCCGYYEVFPLKYEGGACLSCGSSCGLSDPYFWQSFDGHLSCSGVAEGRHPAEYHHLTIVDRTYTARSPKGLGVPSHDGCDPDQIC